MGHVISSCNSIFSVILISYRSFSRLFNLLDRSCSFDFVGCKNLILGNTKEGAAHRRCGGTVDQISDPQIYVYEKEIAEGSLDNRKL
jgi:hypothetical protein